MRSRRPCTTLSYSHMSPAAKTARGRRAQRAVAQDAAGLAELELGLAGEHDVGVGADADDDEVGLGAAPVGA